MEKSLKEQIIKAANNIKQKIQKINNENEETQLSINKFFKPITDPLHSVVENQNIRKTMKKTNVCKKNHITSSPNPSMMLIDENIKKSNKIYGNFSMNSSTPNVACFDQLRKDIGSSANESSFYSEAGQSNSEDERNEEKVQANNDSNIKNEINHLLLSHKNISYGVRKEGANFMIGDQILQFFAINNNKIGLSINNEQFELTDGLKELLFYKSPKKQLITEEDKNNYKNILEKSNAHKRNFDPNNQIQGGKGSKYRNIIKPLFYTPNNSSKSGKGLSTLKEYKTDTDLVYWDDPNELVERLRLLIASKNAGNNGHDNEIISIIEELKEAKIIKS